MLNVRAEAPEDFGAVRRINELAFGGGDEAALVEALRGAARPHVSLVAEEDGRVVGHIFFSPVALEPESPGLFSMGLAPMAVLPERQRGGVGSRLVRAGLEECRRAGCGVVVVLGHPEYYPRFGFRPASEKGLRCEYDVPDEVFMATELVPGALDGRPRLVRYHPAFAGV